MNVIRLGIFASFTIAAGVMFSACPRPNGYQAALVYPHLNFDEMVGLHPLPASRHALVLTQDGVIYRANLANPGETPTVFLDLQDDIIEDRGNEEGLLGVALAPDYETSGRFYVNYTAGDPKRNVISRFIASGAAADAGSERVILEIEQPFSNHNGGGMAFGPDGMLYISSGDGGSAGDPNRNGQNTNTLLGKILRIDVAGDGYAIPADNPFAGGGGRGEVWAYGLRNPWRITFDTATGQLWTGDVGQNQWEEVDRIIRGGNYGWNIKEGDSCFGGDVCAAIGLPPRVTYSHEFGCSITGGYVYHGSSMPELDGWYVYGDFCSGRVWAIDAAADAGAAIPLADTGAAIASFAQDAGGEIYMVTFNNAIYQLVQKPP